MECKNSMVALHNYLFPKEVSYLLCSLKLVDMKRIELADQKFDLKYEVVKIVFHTHNFTNTGWKDLLVLYWESLKRAKIYPLLKSGYWKADSRHFLFKISVLQKMKVC